MPDRAMEQSEAVRHLMAMHEEVVAAKYLAPILHMDPSVIVKYAKDGTWNQDTLGKFVISGGHVKFFRKDFLQKCGFMEKEPDKPTVEELLYRIIQLMTDMNWMLIDLLKDRQRGNADGRTE